MLYDTANTYQQFKVQYASYNFPRQIYAERRRGCLVTPEKYGTLNIFATFYVTSRLHEQFSYVTTSICHIKANTPAFQHIYLSYKNWPIYLVYMSK